MSGKKGRVFALLLSLFAVTLQAGAAGNADDVVNGKSEARETSLTHIPAQPLTEAPSCQPPATINRSRRFSSPIHQDVLAQGSGTEFTGIFTFPIRNGLGIRSFSARPRTLLTEEDAWYDITHTNGTVTVFAALRVPENCRGKDCDSKVVIDIVCDHCDAERATLQYGPPRKPWQSIQRAANLRAYYRRSPALYKKKPTVMEKNCGTPGMRCWDFTTTATKMCGGAFDAAITFVVVPGKGAEKFHWRVGKGNTLYEAKVGALNVSRVLQLSPNNRWSICGSRKNKITLRMACEDCTVTKESVALARATKPETPHNAFAERIGRIVGAYENPRGPCKINKALKPRVKTPIGTNHVLQAWYAPGGGCAERESRSDRVVTYSDWMENYKRVAQWEETMNKTVSNSSWSFDTTAECLCHQVRGAVYRVLDWVADNREAIRNGSPNKCFGKIDSANVDNTAYVIPFTNYVNPTLSKPEPQTIFSTKAESEATFSTKSEPEATVSEKSEPEATVSTKLEPEATVSAKSEPEATVSTKSEPEATVSEKSEPEATVVTTPEPEEATFSTEPKREAIFLTEPKPEDTVVTTPEPKAVFLTEPQPEIIVLTKLSPEATISTQSEPETTFSTEPTPESIFSLTVDSEATFSTKLKPEGTVVTTPELEGTVSTKSEPEVTFSVTANPEASFLPKQEPEATVSETTQPDSTSWTTLKPVSTMLYPMLLPRWTDCRGCRKYKPDADPEKVFELINPLPLKLIDNTTVTDERGQTTWRLRSEVPESVLDFGFNFRFTGLFKFPSRNNVRSGVFAARPVTFLTEEEIWNIEDGNSGTRWVYVPLQVPSEILSDSPMTLDINIVCDNCDIARAEMFYLVDRKEWRSVKKRATWDAFWHRAPEPADVQVNAREKTSCTLPGRRCYEFKTTALAFCSTAFDGGLTFHVVPGNSSESYYWVAGDDEEEYSAKVGVIGWMRTVQWDSEDRWSFCRNPTETISLHVMCDGCSISKSGVVAYRPTSPEIPRYVRPIPLVNLQPAKWETERSSCVIKAAAEQGTLAKKDDILRLWLAPKRTECADAADNNHERVARFPELEDRHYLAISEYEIAKDVTKGTWELQFGSQCLCERLRGGIYSVIEGGLTSDDQEIYEEGIFSASPPPPSLSSYSSRL